MTSPLALAPVEDSPHQAPPTNVPSVPPPTTGPPTGNIHPNPVSHCLLCSVCILIEIANIISL